MSESVKHEQTRTRIKKQSVIEAAYRLFSEKGIESVSMLQITREAQVGDVQVYSYFGNKVNLAIAVSTWAWSSVWQDALQRADDRVNKADAYEWVEFYTDTILILYHEKPELLRFSGNYKTFLCREGIGTSEIQTQTDALAPMKENFLRLYERAKTDHSIRTDIPPNEMFTTITHTMLSMAERYAAGLVWETNNTTDHTRELTHVKEMLLAWCKNHPNHSQEECI